MPVYTKQELRLLINKYYNIYEYAPLLHTLLINVHIGPIGLSDKLPLKYIYDSDEVHNNLKRRSRRSIRPIKHFVCNIRLSDVRKIMYTEPLENTPLYLNHSTLGEIAKWRLSLGK
jgi:hypothetical protein